MRSAEAVAAAAGHISDARDQPVHEAREDPNGRRGANREEVEEDDGRQEDLEQAPAQMSFAYPVWRAVVLASVILAVLSPTYAMDAAMARVYGASGAAAAHARGTLACAVALGVPVIPLLRTSAVSRPANRSRQRSRGGPSPQPYRGAGSPTRRRCALL